ncbi:MAG: asparagine synthase (glutamine-hydrolyzing), partial [Sphingomicrobium sp.]
MCGIVGYWSRRGATEEAVARLIEPILHRGPDDHGIWVDQDAGIGLGHRRLSIVDLSPAGHEPMVSDSGRLIVTYNGEIYNHSAMRALLEQQDHAPEGGWKGHSDIETFLHAIECWGLERALAEAVGMFAFALWDRKERRLRLVRDRFGEKPLYYGWAGGDFLFGSELKALRRHPGFDHAVDRAALAAFAARGYVPAPASIYRGIFKLEPGCVLILGAETRGSPLASPPVADGPAVGGMQLSRYWSYAQVVRDGLADPIADEVTALAALDDALAAAVRGQSVADVPVGAFLSGGIDSSAVTACYQKHSSIPVRTFSIGFEEAGFNEADYAKAVARHLGSLHNEHYVTVKEAQAVIPMLPGIYDEPFADSSQIPTFLV